MKKKKSIKTKQVAIVKREEVLPASPMTNIVHDPESIVRYALDKGIESVEVMERLLVMRKELKAEQAKKHFDQAMASFQSECPPIKKMKTVLNKGGASIRYKYAPLDDIVSQVKNLLRKYEFSYSINAEVKQGWVKAICEVTHADGHSKQAMFECPIEKDAFMNEPQKYASALTFCKRYAFCSAFGILTADEDLDGKLSQDKPIAPSKMQVSKDELRPFAQELWNILGPIRGKEKNWDKANLWLLENEIIGEQEELPLIEKERYVEVIKKAKDILKKRIDINNPLGV